MNGNDGRSFGSCITMECNYDWRSCGRNNENINKYDHFNNHNNHNNRIYQKIIRRSKIGNGKKKSKTQETSPIATNTILTPLLLFSVSVLLLITTALLIFVISLRTQRTAKTTSTTTTTTTATAKFNSIFNNNLTNADHLIHQNPDEVHHIQKNFFQKFFTIQHFFVCKLVTVVN